MRTRALMAASALILSLPGAAGAHLIAKPTKPLNRTIAAQQKNLNHADYVCARGSGEPKRWHCAALRWIKRELQESRLKSTDWRAYLLRLVGPSVYHGCAMPLIGRETGGTYSPTIWNGQGSGAYGLGQALPAKKMAPYGADYMTNGVTQIRWMNDYVQRYGGWCGANAFQLANRWY